MNNSIEIKQLRTLFKYVSNSPTVVNGIFVNHKIRFTQPAALNDPLEFNPAIRFNSDDINFRKFKYRGITMPSIHDWYRTNLIESRINNYGILSLTDNPYSFEMWSHYANGHKGFLIEFNITDKSKPDLEIIKDKILRAHKVRYVKNYHINIDQLERNKPSIPFHRIRDKIFLRKTSHWRHEGEYRIVRPLSDCATYVPPKRRTSYRDTKVYLFPIAPICISSVIFGVNTPRKVKQKIINSCQGTKINFLQTIILKDLQNKIKFVPIDSFGSIDKFLSLLPQLLTTDSIQAKYKNPIPVTSLNEIPFYNIQSRDYDVYYKKQVAKRRLQIKESKSNKANSANAKIRAAD